MNKKHAPISVILYELKILSQKYYEFIILSQKCQNQDKIKLMQQAYYKPISAKANILVRIKIIEPNQTIRHIRYPITAFSNLYLIIKIVFKPNCLLYQQVLSCVHSQLGTESTWHIFTQDNNICQTDYYTQVLITACNITHNALSQDGFYNSLQNSLNYIICWYKTTNDHQKLFGCCQKNTQLFLIPSQIKEIPTISRCNKHKQYNTVASCLHGFKYL
eukprot:TRINITY_DN6348_c0_g2_i1.p1 TRINITY_DN6348_c0_g2~~TRINITY_DN6348_c0_g2_i1.p1  ORF type:complete len:218 (-),score=-29.48 TRINITY_DN6348_c0_g2_i1:185-838(-)